MAASEGLLADLAGAILDGTPIDWDAAESSADDSERPLVARLRLVAGVADVHRETPRVSPGANPSGLSLTITANDDETARPERWAHLQVLERIGSGAFGEVYRAWDPRLDREVALKLLPASAGTGDARATSIIEEGRLLARVDHPNVVSIFGADRIDGRVGLWMELVKGRTLQEVVEQGHGFSVAEVVDVGVQLCDAVTAVHRAGLIHRDIKAHNVMRADDGCVKLMDFGTGREMGGRASALAGTPLYLAPELLDGVEPTVRSDVYSLGVLLYHLLTGSYPVRSRDRRGLELAHERRERINVLAARPDLPPRLARIIDRAIAHEPADRHESARALAVDLTAFKVRLGSAPWRRAIAVAAAMLVVVWGTWEIRGRQNGNPSPTGVLLAGLAPWLPSGGPEVTPVANPVIVVLPFENLSREPGSETLADGLTVGLIQQLTAIEGLQVRPQTSSFMLRDSREISVESVTHQLAANLVLEGTAQLVGDVLRVKAQLLRTAKDVLWSGQFDRQITSSHEIFSIQDDIARAIVNALRLKLGRGERRYDTSVPLPVYYKYVQARRLQERRGHKSAAEAAALYQGCVTSHPDFAPAWAGLASALAEAVRLSNPEVGLPSDDDVARVRAAAIKAIDLDPRLADAHASMGVVSAYERDWTRAEAAFEEALQLNSSQTTIHTDYVLSTLMPQGRSEEALRLLADAQATDPLSLDVKRVMAIMQLDSGRYDEAIQTCQWLQARSPEFPFVTKCLGRALALSGRHQDALAIFRKDPEEWGMLGYVYAVMGRRAEAEAIAAEHPDAPGRRMLIYAGLEDKDRAFAEFERTVVLNWWLAVYQVNRPELTLLRGDSRVSAVRQRLGLPPG